jgi:hypothetical protein
METSQVWQELIEYARRAPSPHNIQPWRIRINSETEATLSYDPTRLIPDTDPTGCFTTIGFGIFLEYLRIAASHKNLILTWESLRTSIDRSSPQPEPFFKLILSPGGGPDPLTPDLILERKTSRLPYKGEQPVEHELLSELEQTASSFGNQLKWSQEPDMVKWLLMLNRDTLFYDMDDDVARTEVGHWIRYTEQEATARADGLAAKAMLMPGWLMRLFFRNHHLINLPVVKQMVQWYYMRSMRGTTTIAWIAGPFAQHEDWLKCGQMLGRLWLLMTKQHVYLHPFGSIITNKTAHGRLSERISYTEGENPLWLVVRLGHSDTPPTSKRLTVEQILL